MHHRISKHRFRLINIVSFHAVVFATLATQVTTRAENLIDVLILYNEEAEEYFGGADGVEASINGIVALSNLTFENSEIDVIINVNGLEKIDYVEDPDDMGIDLRYITNDPEIALIRNQTGADLVSFFRGRPDTGNVNGKAWLLTDSSGDSQIGFNVVSAESALSGFVFQHEIGHNLGGAHDRENSEGGGLFPYSHGYRFNANGFEFRTVMAYRPGNPINYFSNPKISFEGSSIGIASGSKAADNARTFNISAPTIAAYREHIHAEPIANAGPDLAAIDIDGNGSESIVLDGSNSEVEWGEPTWIWTWDGGEALGPIVGRDFPVGETVVTLTVTDVEGFSDQDTVTVTVRNTSPIASIETGDETSFFIEEGGSLWGSGETRDGQLGIGTNEEQFRPILILDGQVNAVSSGYSHTLILMEDGALWATGENGNGQLGTGGSENALSPIKILDTGVSQISAGFYHSLFLKTDGSVWAMGYNGAGQLGDGSTTSRQTPIQIFDSGVKEITAGSEQSLFLKDDGSLWASGATFGSQPYNPTTRPIEVVDSGVVSIAASGHSLFIKENGSLWGFGPNREGQLGDGTDELRALPVEIVEADVVSAAAGVDITFFVKTDGSVWYVGKNLADPSAYNSFSGPQRLLAGGGVSVSAGSHHALILRQDASVWGLGGNYTGQLGLGDAQFASEVSKIIEGGLPRLNEAPVARPGSDFTIPDGDGDGLVRFTLDGSGSTDDWLISSWKWSWLGGEALGPSPLIRLTLGVTEVTLTVTDDDGTENSASIEITVTPQTDVVAVSASHRVSVILKEDGSLWGAGDNWVGLLGQKHVHVREFAPIESSGVVAFSTSLSNTLYIKSDGSLWGLGDNTQGAIGSPDEYVREPYQMLDSGVVAIEAGYRASFYILSDGSAWGMGDNYNGKLGFGNADNIVPAQKIFEGGVKSISASERSALFTMEDGSLWAAGEHGFGGQGYHSRELKKVFDSGVVNAVAGNWFNLILFDDGSVKAIGSLVGFEFFETETLPFEIVPSGAKAIDLWDHSYQNRSYHILMEDGSVLGNGLRTLFYSGVVATAVGEEHSLFLREDGSVWGMGSNYRGALGQGQDQEFSMAVSLFESDNPVEDFPPAAEAGPDQEILDTGADGNESVRLDATASSDDWQIASYNWSWVRQSDNEVFSVDTDNPILSEHFEVGETVVTLTVFDNAGQIGKDELQVTILEGESFTQWLSRHFSESQISAMSPNPGGADPDNDGYSNNKEFELGIDPTEALDPVTQSNYKLVSEDEEIYLEVTPYTNGFIYEVSTTVDFNHWQVFELPSYEYNGKLRIDLPYQNTRFYQLKIFAP